MRALIGRAIRWFLDAVPASEVRLRMDEAAVALAQAEWVSVSDRAQVAAQADLRAVIKTAIEDANERLLAEIRKSKGEATGA